MKFRNSFDNFFQSNERLFPSDFFQNRESFFQAERETIKEEDDKFTISVDLPGVDSSTIEVTVDQDKLCVASERDGRKSSQDFRFGDTINEDGIRAAYKNGVLTVELPKREKAQPRHIEVST